MNTEARLDNVDWQILRELQANARLPFAELGRRVGLTSPAVAERVRRLEDAGIIAGYRAELNLDRLGRPLQAYIRFAHDEPRCADLNALARELPEVIECHRVTGEDCCILRVAVGSTDELESLIDRLMPYGRTTTCIVLSSPLVNRIVEPPGPREAPKPGRIAPMRLRPAGAGSRLRSR